MLRIQECVKKVLLLVICIGCTIGCNSVDDTIKIKFTGKSPVTVQRGHSVVIAANTYNVAYNATKYDSCLVYITSTPTFSCGTISPDVFNYSTRPDLLYTHYGCERDMESFDLAFSLMSSNHNVFTTEHLTIRLTVTSITEPILKPSDRITVPPDTLKAFVSLKLSDHLGCEYAIVSPVHLPYYGVVTGPAVKQWLPCNSNQSLEYTFNQSMAYTLNHYQQYQPEDRIIVAIKNDSSITYEQIPVVIDRSNNRRTSCGLQEGEVLVAFNCYAPVNVDSLMAPNCSFFRDWKITIERGRNSAISPVTSRSSTFTFGQLQDGMVAYHRRSSSPTHEELSYQYSVYDVYGKVIFSSSVVTKSTTLAGQYVQIETNTGIDVVEGQSTMITDSKLDFILHTHPSCPNYTLNLLEAPRHGYFRLARTNESVVEVTEQDLHNANIIFEHSGDDNFGDYVIWEVQCFNITLGEFLQPIRVIIKDNSPPYLSENTAISVYSNSTVQLSQFHLQARDVDSSDANLKYTIITANGNFYNSREDALTSNATTVTQFTQKDIDDGKVWYRPPENIDLPQSDIVLFNVSDESPLPNVLPNQKLSINIKISYECAFCEEELDPHSLSFIPVVEIGGETNLLAIHFSPFTKHFAPYEQLEFHIVNPPQFGSVIPGNFTLDSLKKDKVVYRHKGIDHGCNDSFEFRLHNITGEKIFGKMIVSIIEHNTTRSVTLKVNPVEFSLIHPTLAPDSIVITDAPVCTEHILFVIKSLPASGKLYCSVNNTELVVGSWFSLKHVKDDLIAYHTVVNSNQNESIYSDNFSFSLDSPLKNLTANGHRIINYPITYNLLDPMMTLNPAIIPDNCNENEFLCYYNLTVSNIKVVSSIANDSELRIVIKDGPSCGRMVHGRTEITEFTMLQVKRKEIAYEFNASLCNNGNYTDKFGFIIEIINHPASPVKNYLHFLWSYIMVNQSKIEMNETDETFTITVRRGGYLNQTSEVFCTKGSYSANLCKTCNQVQVATFLPGQKEANCSFNIENNKIAEGKSVKKYYVSLKHPDRAITTSRNVTEVYVSDWEDYPVIQFTGMSPSVDGTSPCTHETTVKEGENFVVSAMIERIGDSSKEVSVMCMTVTNDKPNEAKSSQDYQERDKKWVTFAPGQKIAFCNVTILDDDEYEKKEYFQLKLDRPRILGKINESANTVCVYIVEDPSDSPVVFFSRPSMTVLERKRNHEYLIPMNLTRKPGEVGDSLEVFYSTRILSNDTAKENEDFQAYTNQNVSFASTQSIAYGQLLILSDNDDNESSKTLHIELIPSSEDRYRLGYPSMITITIDSYTVLSFTSNAIAVNETGLGGAFYLYINRTGSLDNKMVVSGALVHDSKKYLVKNSSDDLSNTSDASTIGVIIDDLVYDEPRTMRYCLIAPENEPDIKYKFVHQCIDITFYDYEDYPTVELEHARYVVRMPDYQECNVLTVSVVRNNDISQITSTVNYSTFDDSAVAGKQYRETSGVLNFAAGKKRKFISIKICAHDLPSNQTKTFHVRIVKNDNATRIAAPSVAEVVILGREPVAPFFRKEVLLISSVDMVLPSDFHHDTSGQRFLACVTSCDPLLPSHFDARFCEEHGIDNNLTKYEWEISYDNGPFTAVTYSTFFASPHNQILNEFYLLPRSKVRCIATAVDMMGIVGYKRSSEALVVGEESSQPHCVNNTAGVRVEIHQSSLFTGQPQDSIKLSGSLDGSGNGVPMLYSQHPSLSVFTYYPTRRNSCILLTGTVTHTGLGSVVANDCAWEFEVWVTLHELEKNCYATISYGANQTSIHLELELAYFHGNVSGGIELEQYRSHLNVSANLFHKLPPAGSNSSYSKYDAGFIKILDVSLEDVLVVRFQSFANFSGQFILNTSNVSSSVSSNQNISLFLEETVPSVNNCTQRWRFQSAEMPLIGMYNINLVPCVLPDHLTWSPSVTRYCMPTPPVTFQLYIPLTKSVLPQQHTPETEVQLLKRAKNGSHHVDWRFSEDDTIFGGIKIDTEHQQRVNLAVQKVIACSTMSGYVPQFNQQASLSGCLTHTPFITKSYTILDVNTTRNSNDTFDAEIIDSISSSYGDIQTGWSFKAKPLFDMQVWFIHIIYTETQNNDVTFKQDIRLIHLVTKSYSTEDMSTSQTWCKTVVTVTIILSLTVMVLLVVSLICWKWSKVKDKYVAIFGDCYGSKSETSPLAKIRRHRFRAEIQELPPAFLPPNGIHANSEHCTKINAPTATQATGSSANKRLTGSKKYIVETAM